MTNFDYIVSKVAQFCAGNSDAELELDRFMYNHAPSGSGINRGTKINWEVSGNPAQAGQAVVLDTSFDHMNEHGFYTHKTDHQIKIRPVLLYGPFDLQVTGRNYDDIKEYLADVYYLWLRQEKAEG